MALFLLAMGFKIETKNLIWEVRATVSNPMLGPYEYLTKQKKQSGEVEKNRFFGWIIEVKGSSAEFISILVAFS